MIRMSSLAAVSGAAMSLLLAVAPVSVAAQPSAPATALRMPEDKPKPHYLTPADILPQRLFAQPPARGSEVETQEMAYLRALIAATAARDPARIDQARADGEDETPALYNDTLGVDLKTLPATWNLLVTVQDEAVAVADLAKDAFMRARPYVVDPQFPTCVRVDPAKGNRSYPSGHASVGYSVGWVLARLVPDMAPGILARGDDYALSRQICGQHFPSDTAASHAVAELVAEKLLADPRLADQVAAARAELARR